MRSWSRKDLPISNPVISVVIPVYRNAGTLAELQRRLGAVLDGLGLPYELIFVNDACPDGSLGVLEDLALRDAHVVLVRLPKNIGQQRAVLAGLARAHGTSIVVLDADLQDSPEAIPVLLDALDGQASAAFAGRRGSYALPGRLLTSRLFKAVLQVLCGTPADAGLFVAMDQPMRQRLLEFDEPGPLVLAMMGCTGLRLVSVPVRRTRRTEGRSSYRVWQRLMMSVQVIAWVIRQKRRAMTHHE